MDPLKRLTSPVIALPQENIDTDQIVPARFLSVTRFDELADAAFADWRFDAEGQPRPDCPLNGPGREREILVAGDNFGCGSSREHAPRALLQFGIRAVFSTRIADIFRNNALTCGLLAVEIEEAPWRWMMAHPDRPVTVDLEARKLDWGVDCQSPLVIDDFARDCLMAGRDTLGFLLSRQANIAAFEATRP